MRRRPLSRTIASALALLLGAAGLTLVNASAAVAATASDANSHARLTVTAHADPNNAALFILSGTLVPVNATDDCGTSNAMYTVKIGATSAGFLSYPIGRGRDVFLQYELPAEPGPFTVDISARAGCTGPDGLYPNLQFSLTVDPDDLVAYYTASVHGTAYQGAYPATGAGDYAPASGVVVDLMDASLGATGTPVASSTTGTDGVYWMQAPVATQAEVEHSYRLRFTYPDATVVYHDGGTLDAYTSSTGDWDAAEDIGGPRTWSPSANVHDAMHASTAPPSATATSRLCNDVDSQQLDEVDTGSVVWEDVCETDPTFYTAHVTAGGAPAALDRIGRVWIDQHAGAYQVTADSFSSETAGGALTTTLHDDDIHLADQNITVDVTVVRILRGSDARWSVEVRDSDTGALVEDLPFSFTGSFQNDARTTWTSVGGDGMTWLSDGGSARVADAHEAMLAHRIDAEDASVHTDLESVDVEVASGGTLSYTLAVLDYTGCAVGAARTQAATVAAGLGTSFGTARAVLTGDACVVTWPAPALGTLRVGEPYDRTFPVTTTSLDWTNGGAVWIDDALPAGLTFETVGEYTAGVTPSFRIVGTPTTAGAFSIPIHAMDAMYRPDATTLAGTVLPPEPSASIALDAAVGDEVAGATADVDGTGLAPGSSYQVVVESTPQTIGSGTIGADYLLDDTVTLPAGLEAGWHRLSLSGTFAGATTLTRELWFQVADDGTLAATSETAPVDPGDPDPAGPGSGGTGPDDTTTPSGDDALAGTGADVTGPLGLALLLLVAGCVALRRRPARG